MAAAAPAAYPSSSRCFVTLAQDIHPEDGYLLLPGHPDYEARRRGFNLRLQAAPAAIFVCQTATAVRQACQWSRAHGVPLHLRAGGHSYEGFNNGSGLLLDLSGMHAMHIDAERGIAHVGAGTKQGPLRQALAQRGWIINGGTCPTVGVAGLTLGGGYGLMSRRCGLTCDNLMTLDMVDAHGVEHSTQNMADSDLLWASRGGGGGGGNFGVVTSLTLNVYPAEEVVTFALRWPASDAAKVIQAWQHWAPLVDEGLTCRLVINANAEHGIDCIIASGMFIARAGKPCLSESKVLEMLRPLHMIGYPSTQVRRCAIAHSEDFADYPTPPTYFKAKSDFATHPLDGQAIGHLLHGLSTLHAGSMVVILSPGGGAIARLAPDATAHVHRQAIFGVQYFSSWETPQETAAHMAAMRQLYASLRPYFNGGAYVNYVDLDLQDWERAYFGNNFERLMRIKTRFDPESFFYAGPQAIPCAPGTTVRHARR